jgi:hypothetical protein
VPAANFGLPRVCRELGIIRDDLHCTAVHLVGGDPQLLEVAARLAAELGLEVWFSPYPIDLTPDETLALFADCATRAEQVRADGAEVVFVAGVELSLMNRGFVEGDGIDDRLRRLLANPALFADARDRLGAFLPAAARTVRSRSRTSTGTCSTSSRSSSSAAPRSKINFPRGYAGWPPGRSRSPSPGSAPRPGAAPARWRPAAWRCWSTTRSPGSRYGSPGCTSGTRTARPRTSGRHRRSGLPGPGGPGSAS